MKNLLSKTCLMLLIAAPMSFALDADQLRGEVVEVLNDSREIRLQISEAGDDLKSLEGRTETFYVPEGTRFEFEVESVLYDLDTNSSLDDLSEGDTVMLAFDEVDQRKQTRSVRSENTQSVAVQDRVKSEGMAMNAEEDQVEIAASNRSEELPESASLIPLLALMGVIFAAFGGVLRFRRHG